MMQSTESGQRDDLISAWRRQRRRRNSTSGRVLPQSKMSPVFVVIADIVSQQPSQVSLVQNDHVVKQVPTHTPDPALGDAVLPGTSKSGSDRLDVAFSDRRDDISREFRVAVKDQVPMWLFVSPSFAQLQYDPRGVGLTGHVAVQNLPPVVSDDKEAVQDTEGQCRHGEEIHGGDCFAMVPEKSQPAPRFIGALAASHIDSQCLCTSKKAPESKPRSPFRNSPRVQSSVMMRRKSQFRFSLADHQRVTANGIKCGSLHAVSQASSFAQCSPFLFHLSHFDWAQISLPLQRHNGWTYS